MKEKILFTTSYTEKTYDYIESNTLSIFRVSTPRLISSGLRFIKQNIPEIEILEYPTWEEYTQKIKENWDIVGFSFYLDETHEILKMIEYARAHGIKEIWGGNYGILTPSIQKYFDRIFIGYSEFEIAKILGKKIDRLRHPPLITYVNLPFVPGLKIIRWCGLFTTRGCSFKCSFCQTPKVCPKPEKIPIQSIEEVLKYYKELGIRSLLIGDESFGILPKHADEVVSLIEKYKFYWGCMTRANFLKKNLEQWIERRFVLSLTGIENLSPENLRNINKKQSAHETISVFQALKKEDFFPVGYYIIGFENETTESIKNDIKKLKRLNTSMMQVCILTPLPQTSLWDYLDSKFGIFEKDWHKFNTKHLVWNHPSINPDEMQKLLKWSLRELNRSIPFKYLDVRLNLYKKGMKFTRYFRRAQTFDYDKKRFLP